MQSFLDQYVLSQAAGSAASQFDNDDDEFENECETLQKR